MKTPVTRLKKYENETTREAKGERKEAFTTKKELKFNRRLNMFVEEEARPEVQKSRCVIL